ncbi:MAG: right-handed parallel beta-helix repeat-containing protein, partial [Bacteroidota bacterium]
LWLTKKTDGESVIYCDMEHRWKRYFISGGKFFEGSRTRSAVRSRSGKYASFLPKGSQAQYGLDYLLKVQPGDEFTAEVWVQSDSLKDNPAIFITEVGLDYLMQRSGPASEKDLAGWWKLSVTFQIPDDSMLEELSVFLASEGKAEVFFDDFQIRRTGSSASRNRQLAYQAPALEIQMKDKSFDQIQAQRKKAFRDGVLITDKDSWVKASLVEGDSTYPVKARLKGDWLTHLEGEKWSFRLKVKDPFAWKGLKTFSLHHPEARQYLWEWVIHQFWEREDVLTTRYDFARLTLNERPVGLYAYEEHFDKQLLESRKRREGPIIRFAEEGMWDYRARVMQWKGKYNQEFLHANAYAKNAEIRPFNEKKMAASPQMAEQHQIAHQLMHQFQSGQLPAASIFDVKRLAAFFAIADLMGAWHAMVWHNIRYYYNPITSKLEPIGFDAYEGRPNLPLLLGQQSRSDARQADLYPKHYLFRDEAFLQHYLHELFRLSSRDYLEDFVADIGPDFEARLKLLQTEFPELEMTTKEILDRSSYVYKAAMPYQEHSVKVEWTADMTSRKRLKLRNLHLLPLRIIGFGTSALGPQQDTSFLLLPAPTNRDTLHKYLDVPTNTQYVFYEAPGIDSVFKSRIPTRKASDELTPFQYLFANIRPQSNPMYEVKADKHILFKRGRHEVLSRIVIPAGYEVVFEPGVELDFTGTTFFLSQSPITINGTEEAPVIFRSLQRKARGFTVLQSPKKSVLQHAIFEGFNTLDIDGWRLTGAVTFYESDVDIRHCFFKGNVCEDGLNVVRSKVEIYNSKVFDTFSDGIDLDFCEGRIEGSYFEETGNDGLDVSGSQIYVDDCFFERCGDKGISVGEKSSVEVGKVRIQDAVIGVASKDLSELRIRHIKLADCNQGFAAYQKKAEFGHSTLTVETYEAERIRFLYTIAPGSVLKLEGEEIR